MKQKSNRITPLVVFIFQLALWGIYPPIQYSIHSIYSTLPNTLYVLKTNRSENNS